MKINFVSFLDPRVFDGGGEKVSLSLLESGIALGHDIRVSSVRPHKLFTHKNADLTFFVDIFNHGHTFKSFGAWRHFDENFLSSLMVKPFIHMASAYADICNLPYLPCSGNKYNLCLFKPPLNPLRRLLIKDWGNKCFSEKKIIKDLHNNALLNIFLSPLHLKMIERVLGQTLRNNAYLLPPIIDTSIFYNQNIERDIDYLFVGVIGEAKGFNTMKELYFDKNIYLIGRKEDNVNLNFGVHIPHIPYSNVPQYMNRSKNLVMLPRWPEPQGRVVSEAALCGCKIIGNDNVGALSFNADLANPEFYKNVELTFWNEVVKKFELQNKKC